MNFEGMNFNLKHVSAHRIPYRWQRYQKVGYQRILINQYVGTVPSIFQLLYSISANIWLNLYVFHVGKYTFRPLDPMGYDST